jgi:hypothetical protein
VTVCNSNGLGQGLVGMLNFMTKWGCIKFPIAPESMKAVVAWENVMGF